ncbi:hypothetical protein LUZ60_002016 [Juncus effusus]|nr:hypothetical protein LUZ60_002016 [Juncus effusus]
MEDEILELMMEGRQMEDEDEEGNKGEGEKVQLVKESAIMVSKRKIINMLQDLIEEESELEGFKKLVCRVEYVIRAWHHKDFDILMDSYLLFDPVGGAARMKERNLTSDEIDELEQKFLKHLFEMMKKSYFSIVTDREFDVAQSGSYLLNLPIVVDESRIDHTLFSKYFKKYPTKNLPGFSDKFIIFRRGIGIDKTTGYFFWAKVDIILSLLWAWTGLEKICSVFIPKSSPRLNDDDDDDDDDDSTKTDEEREDVQYFHVERIKLEKAIFKSFHNLFGKVLIQEPTFERMIMVYRRPSTDGQEDRGIHVKHFKDIPMADMELVLPEKKNPSLTPKDWVMFLASGVIALAAVYTSTESSGDHFWVAMGILSVIIGNCVKIYWSFTENIKTYRHLMTQATYDKQLDNGKGTLLHLCHDLIEQEVKEVILSFFLLMKTGEATKEDLDKKCEDFLKEKFNKQCDFDVDDAVDKLDRLGIVIRINVGEEGSMESIRGLPLENANVIMRSTMDQLNKDM